MKAAPLAALATLTLGALYLKRFRRDEIPHATGRQKISLWYAVRVERSAARS